MHNKCDLCIEHCYTNALYFDHKNKITLKTELCTNCDSCIGSCPSEALFDIDFDQNLYVKEFDKEIMSCKDDLPCIGIFNVFQLIYLSLKKREAVKIDITPCKGCEKNRDNKIVERFLKNLEEMKRFLSIFGKEGNIEVLEDYAPNTRREFFKKLLKGKKSHFNEMETKDKYIPEYLSLFETSLAELEYKEDIFIEADEFSFLHSKSFDLSCNGCGDCSLFCPTDAIKTEKDNKGFRLGFNPFFCIGCGNCIDVCKQGSINKDKIKLSALLEGRYIPKLELEYSTCKVCKCAFLSHSIGEDTCDRCSVSEKMLSGLFTLARDL